MGSVLHADSAGYFSDLRFYEDGQNAASFGEPTMVSTWTSGPGDTVLRQNGAFYVRDF